MKKILIVGAGAMGAAFSIPLLDNGHSVTLTEPYNFKLLQKLNLKKKIHPSLNINLPQKLKINKFSSDILNQKWDLIVIAVSSIGIDLIGKNLSKIKNKLPILVLTKGLKLDGSNLISISSLLKKYNKNLNISVLKGPCLAKELAKKVKSFTVVANKNINTAKKIGKLISTNYYQTEFSRDVNGGLGDLYVSAMGGRNSKMGEYLGKGYTFTQAKKKFMKNDTVEGADLAIEIAPFVFKKINKRKVPLMISLLEAIVKNKKLKIKY